MSYWVPSQFKAKTKISSKLIPFVFVVDDWSEHVGDNIDNAPLLREKTYYFSRAEKMTMQVDIVGRPVKFKVYVDPRSKAIVPIDNLIADATKNMELGRFKGTFNTTDPTGRDLINKVYDILDVDTRRQISRPSQWLIYDRTNKVLTRLCYMIQVNGEIIVRPFGATNILLDAESGKVDHVNNYSRKYMLGSYKAKEHLDQHWLRMQLSEEIEEFSSEFGETEEEAGTINTEAEVVGKVE